MLIATPPIEKLAPYIAIALALITKYLFSDWQFLIYLIVFVGLDEVTGAIVAIKARQFNVAGFGRFVNKAFTYSVLLIVSHVLTHFEIHGVINWIFKMVDAVIYTVLMGREAVLIFDNVTKLDPELLPDPVRVRLRQALISVPERILMGFINRAIPLDPADTTPPTPAPTEEPITPDAAPVESDAQPQPTP